MHRKCWNALEARHAVKGKPARVRSLDGKNLVFTGGLSLLRAKAKQLARAAGATVQANVNRETDMVVAGDQPPHWKAETKGQKLLDVDREAERGHNIAILTEARFLKLAGHQR